MVRDETGVGSPLTRGQCLDVLLVHAQDQAIAAWAERTGRPTALPEPFQAAWDAVIDERIAAPSADAWPGDGHDR